MQRRNSHVRANRPRFDPSVAVGERRSLYGDEAKCGNAHWLVTRGHIPRLQTPQPRSPQTGEAVAYDALVRCLLYRYVSGIGP